MSKVVYKEREFDLTLKVENNTLQRAIINDGGLEFPFPNYEKAAEFLVGEYGGELPEALKALSDAESLEGITVPGAPVVVNGESGKGKGKGKGGNKKSDKKEQKKDEKKDNKEEKTTKTVKPEKVKMTFELKDGPVVRDVQVKVILPDQKPLDTETKTLTETITLHIDRYSEKNRTSKLIRKKEDGAEEILIENVSLMDAIYKFAEVAGMSFAQADKYIKIKRGLLPEPEKKNKEEKKVTAEDLKGKKVEEVKEEAKSEESVTAE